MLVYYQKWILVFAGLGYLLGLSIGLSVFDSFWLIPLGGFAGLILAVMNEKQKFITVFQAWLTGWGIIGIFTANLAFGWHVWGVVPFAGIMVIIAIPLFFLSGIEPAREWQK